MLKSERADKAPTVPDLGSVENAFPGCCLDLYDCIALSFARRIMLMVVFVFMRTEYNDPLLSLQELEREIEKLLARTQTTINDWTWTKGADKRQTRKK